MCDFYPVRFIAAFLDPTPWSDLKWLWMILRFVARIVTFVEAWLTLRREYPKPPKGGP